MTSPLVNRLASRIKQSSKPEERYFLVAELGCYWARVGNFDEAEIIRRDVRAEFGDGRNLRVSVMLMCLEALLLYYRELNPAARDRLARAQLLSKGAKDGFLIAFTSSWLAHIDFNLNDFEAMLADLRDCFDSIEADDGSAECRASILLGDAFLFVGDSSASQRWYERGRRAAVQIGDQAAIGALIYNRAALRVLSARLAKLRQPLSESILSMIAKEVDSAINYQAAAQTRSLDHLLKSAKSGILILRGRYLESEAILKGLIESSDLPEKSSQRMLLEADLVLVCAQNQRLDEAKERLLQIGEPQIGQLNSDDRAILLSSLTVAATQCGQEERASRFSLMCDSALNEHLGRIQDLKLRIARYSDGVD